MSSTTLDRSPHHAPLAAGHRCWLALFLLVIVGFGIHVEIRSCFLQRHQTDLDVYLRAAWAVRTGADIYDITDDNVWHYQYPPLFAILMAPLADPPPGADRSGYLPLAVSAALWYLFSIACLCFAVHKLAGILEEGSANPAVRSVPAGSVRWWRLRLVPVLVCVIPTGQTLTRGQVSLLLLALLANTVADLYHRRPARAGLWLAGAICLKVIPVFLLLIPLWQRNLRCLAACALGLVVGLVLIPAAVFGLPRTIAYYIEYDAKVLRPGVGNDEDYSRADELTRVTSTDSQSLVAMIHNTTYPDRSTRPRDATGTVRRIHWLVGGLLTLVTLGAAWRGTPRAALPLVLFVGGLVFNMLILSPVCHLHYYSLLIPLTMGMLAYWWEGEAPRFGGAMLTLFTLIVLTGLLPVLAEEVDRAIAGSYGETDYEALVWRQGLPPMVLLRDVGLATYGAAALWISACVVLRRRADGPTARSVSRAPQAVAA